MDANSWEGTRQEEDSRVLALSILSILSILAKWTLTLGKELDRERIPEF